MQLENRDVCVYVHVELKRRVRYTSWGSDKATGAKEDRYVSPRQAGSRSRVLPLYLVLNRMPGYSHACQFPLLEHATRRRDLYVNVNMLAERARERESPVCTPSPETTPSVGEGG